MLKMIIVSLCFKSISFPAGNIAIIRASRVASAALNVYQWNESMIHVVLIQWNDAIKGLNPVHHQDWQKTTSKEVWYVRSKYLQSKEKCNNNISQQLLRLVFGHSHFTQYIQIKCIIYRIVYQLNESMIHVVSIQWNVLSGDR